MNIRERELIKIDRNGTKYYHDWKCPHCDGQGSRREWSATRYTCWKCNGTGQLAEPRTVKEYTPEYLAVMAEKNRQKQEKKIAERIAAYTADMSKAYREVGFNDEGKMYIVTEKYTYGIKDELKAAGGRWFPHLSRWGFTSRPEQWETVAIDWGDFYEINEYGVIREKVIGYMVIDEMMKGEPQ